MLVLLLSVPFGHRLTRGVHDAQVALSLMIGEGVAQRLRTRIFEALMQQSAGWYDVTPADSLTTVIGADVEIVQAAVVRLLGARVPPDLLFAVLTL